MELLFKKGTKVKVKEDIYYCEIEDVEAKEFIRDCFINKEGALVLPKGLVIIYNGLSDNDFDEFIIGQGTYEFAEVNKTMFERI